MADQSDLVIALAEFQPRLVKMDAGGHSRYSGDRSKGKQNKRRKK